MHLPSSTKFEHTGVFEGFFRNDEGKKRLLLRLRDESTLEFKLEKELRKDFEEELVPGALITVTGFQKQSLTHRLKRVIKRIKVQFSPPPKHDPCAKCPIHVCAKKNCWKSGGKELMQQLRERVQAEGFEDRVDLRAVGCLDECKRAPNVKVGKGILTRSSAETVERIVAELKVMYPQRESRTSDPRP